LSSLQGWDMVLLDIPHSREYFLDMLVQADVDTKIRYSSRSHETVRSLVARGHGFSILNNISKSDSTYDGATLMAIPIEDNVPPWNVCHTHPPDERPPARARTVATTAARLMQEDNLTQSPVLLSPLKQGVPLCITKLQSLLVMEGIFYIYFTK